MRYYTGSKGDYYYYLEESSRKVYDDKVIEPSKDPPVETTTSSFSSSSLSSKLKSYLDELVGKLLEDNHTISERIMAHIDSMAKESEGSRYNWRMT